jgi:hypothetical protein
LKNEEDLRKEDRKVLEWSNGEEDESVKDP